MKSHILKLAIKQAQKVRLVEKTNNRYRLGAVIFDKNQIISVGNNDYTKTHTRSNSVAKGNDGGMLTRAIHAEFSALINNNPEDLIGSDILVVRIDPFSQLRMAKPCTSCYSLIKEARIRNLYWSDNFGQIIKQRVI